MLIITLILNNNKNIIIYDYNKNYKNKIKAKNPYK